MENSNLSVSKEYGLTVVIHHNILFIDGVYCDDRDTNLTCIGVIAVESERPKKSTITGLPERIRVDKNVPNAIEKEIKFTY